MIFGRVCPPSECPDRVHFTLGRWMGVGGGRENKYTWDLSFCSWILLQIQNVWPTCNECPPTEKHVYMILTVAIVALKATLMVPWVYDEWLGTVDNETVYQTQISKIIPCCHCWLPSPGKPPHKVRLISSWHNLSLNRHILSKENTAMSRQQKLTSKRTVYEW